jgi:IclR family acetate operon transcriptional repressor
LNLFDSSHSELSNAEITNSLALNPSTVAGLVYTLKVNKYLDQNPVNRKYRLGLKIAERASTLFEQFDLRKVAWPYLEEVRDWCGESVNLAILDHKEVVYIERLFGHHSLGIRSELGKRAPVHSTALGKAIAAYLPERELAALLEEYSFIPVTPNTILERKAFEAELEKVCSAGYAVDEQENELGGRCVGAPIFDHRGYPLAALSVSVPVQRLSHEQVPVFGNKLKELSLEISRNFGFLNE